MTKAEAFLARIGLSGTPITHTAAFLGAVQTACVLTIPYENLDILADKPVSLDTEDIYRKIVTEHRGGYCFELNALLHHMLTEMGFAVESRFARYLRGESAIPFRRHRIVVVTLDGAEYMLDIGVGQVAPRLPLKLTEGEIQDHNDDGKFNMEYSFPEDKESGVYTLILDGDYVIEPTEVEVMYITKAKEKELLDSSGNMTSGSQEEEF